MNRPRSTYIIQVEKQTFNRHIRLRPFGEQVENWSTREHDLTSNKNYHFLCETPRYNSMNDCHPEECFVEKFAT